MIFEKEKLQFTLFNVNDLHQKNVHMRNAGRTLDALSFRFSADTDLVTKKGTHHVSDNYVCFVPAHVDYERIAKKDDLVAINCNIHGYTADDIECFRPQNAEKIAKYFEQILECWTRKEAGYMHKCTALFYQILAECCLQSSKQNHPESRIQGSVDYINANYANHALTMEEIAAKSFMSEVYFRKIFKEEYGTSPQKYIIGLRLQKAKELIEIGDYSLKEVACMSGYSDYNYFSAEFKRSFGVSPSGYRDIKKVTL